MAPRDPCFFFAVWSFLLLGRLKTSQADRQVSELPFTAQTDKKQKKKKHTPPKQQKKTRPAPKPQKNDQSPGPNSKNKKTRPRPNSKNNMPPAQTAKTNTPPSQTAKKKKRPPAQTAKTKKHARKGRGRVHFLLFGRGRVFFCCLGGARAPAQTAKKTRPRPNRKKARKKLNHQKRPDNQKMNTLTMAPSFKPIMHCSGELITL